MNTFKIGDLIGLEVLGRMETIPKKKNWTAKPCSNGLNPKSVRSGKS